MFVALICLVLVIRIIWEAEQRASTIVYLEERGWRFHKTKPRPTLKGLLISKLGIVDEMPHIISAQGNTVATDDHLSLLARFPEVENLSVQGSQVTGHGIQNYGLPLSLKSLDVSYSTVDSNAVPAIVRCRDLKMLCLHWCRMSETDVDSIRKALPRTVIVTSSDQEH
jgi:hypothetical protein